MLVGLITMREYLSMNTQFTLFNTLMFIPALSNGDWELAKTKFILLGLLYAASLGVTIVDTVLGVMKSKIRGIKPSSFRFRDTVSKLIGYFNLLILFTMIDFILSPIVGLPYFTIAGCAGVCGIEIKSWIEKATDKEKKDVKTIAMFLQNKDNIAKVLSELINSEADKTKTEKDEQ